MAEWKWQMWQKCECRRSKAAALRSSIISVKLDQMNYFTGFALLLFQSTSCQSPLCIVFLYLSKMSDKWFGGTQQNKEWKCSHVASAHHSRRKGIVFWMTHMVKQCLPFWFQVIFNNSSTGLCAVSFFFLYITYPQDIRRNCCQLAQTGRTK